ncbi:DoxX family protein [Kaistia algarum]|uniref:DoxX family protein n=1 Tax=Kaistia algarum TaxID=2083279 RepID=UPI000CE90A34|nr:DoxX family protein [Kaistia algarum]MCX5515871.1 DoxX family protein [Kaistia algarum]PPE80763.1 DoxX family protein [Kaistia algarum]
MEFKFLERWQPQLLAALRIVAALLFLEHGTSKIMGFPQDAMMDGLPMFSLFWIAGIIEIVGGLLLLIGLFTRPVAFLLSGEMAIAYFMEHAPIDFFPLRNQGDGPILFCFVFLYLAAAGPGAFSLDAGRRS